MNDDRSMHLGQENHLTDDQFAECALGLGVCEETSAHLAGCEACTLELAKFAATMKDFSAGALGWSESRSPMSLQQHVRMAPVERSWLRTASWAMATGVVLVVAGTAITHKTEADPAPHVAEAEDSDTDIARDNELMRNVDLAISKDVPSPVSEYGLRQDDSGPSRAAAESRVQ